MGRVERAGAWRSNLPRHFFQDKWFIIEERAPNGGWDCRDHRAADLGAGEALLEGLVGPVVHVGRAREREMCCWASIQVWHLARQTKFFPQE